MSVELYKGRSKMPGLSFCTMVVGILEINAGGCFLVHWESELESICTEPVFEASLEKIV